MNYYVYILESEINGSFYKGCTNNLDRRLQEHNSKKEKSTARYVPWKVVWHCQKNNKSEAMKLEKKLKNLSRKRIVHFMEKYSIGK